MSAPFWQPESSGGCADLHTGLVKTDAATLAADTPFTTSLLSNCLHVILAPGAVPNGPRNDTEDLQIYWRGAQRQPDPRLPFWRRWFTG